MCIRDRCGTCWTRAFIGESCAGPETVCDEGLYCDAGTCEMLLADGMTCDDSDQCESDVCYELECIAPLAEGDDCSGDGGDGACSLLGAGLWCDPGTSLCAPFPIGGLGDECGLLDPDPITVGFCQGNLRCSEEFPTIGECIPKDGLGDPCTVTGNQPNESTCLPHLHCVGGECVVPVALICE